MQTETNTSIDWNIFSCKNEQSTDSCYNMDEFWKHSKWMKPDIEGHLLQDSIYIKY